MLDWVALTLGEPVQPAEGTLVLKPAVAPVPTAMSDQAVAKRIELLRGRLERVERELEQLGAASEGDDERRTWLRGVLTDERDRLQPKLSQIATPAGRAEALGYPY